MSIWLYYWLVNVSAKFMMTDCQLCIIILSPYVQRAHQNGLHTVIPLIKATLQIYATPSSLVIFLPLKVATAACVDNF